MCGRVNTYNKESIYEIMRMYTDADEWPAHEHFDSQYNVSPGASLPVLYHQEKNTVAAMHWGLVPLWAKPGTFKRPLINARAETVFEKPSFRNLVTRYRCVLPVNGFYEWRRPSAEEAEAGARKAPYYFLPSSGDVLLLGAIYQFNKQGGAECCIITTDANEVMRPIHDRMPVIIGQQEVGDWLGSDERPALESMMEPANDEVLRCYQVSSYVSRATNDGEECIAAVE